MNELAHCMGIGTLVLLAMFLVTMPVFAYEATDKLSINAVIAGTPQYQLVTDATDAENDLRAGLSIQPEVSFTPTDADEFFLKLGFAVGNGLNKISPFALAPWAAALEDDVKDINGRNRDYLLTAWYKHTFQWGEDLGLGLTGGIIDATDYLDENAFANGEYTQFLNEALVNGPNTFAPSFDGGGAAELEFGKFSVKGVFMAVGENEDGRSYQFYGAQLGYRLETSLGEGNYRVAVHTTSKDFLDPQGKDYQSLKCVLLSFDQEFGGIIGGWIRLGWQDDKAAVNCQSLYSGGINISGKLWGRDDDNIGIGYAYLNGGNLDLDNSQVAEAYVRFVLNQYFALTMDVQYMKDKIDDADDPKGFIFGMRMAAEF